MIHAGQRGRGKNRRRWQYTRNSEEESILFYEYFHADNGAGLGASHQTGWTGVVAKLIQLFGLLDAKRALEGGKEAGFVRGKTSDQ